MNQKFLSILIGFGLVAITFGLLIFVQYYGANKSVVKEKFPIISNDLVDSSKISSLISGLQKHGNLPVSAGGANQGRDNPFERY